MAQGWPEWTRVEPEVSRVGPEFSPKAQQVVECMVKGVAGCSGDSLVQSGVRIDVARCYHRCLVHNLRVKQTFNSDVVCDEQASGQPERTS